MKKSKSLNWKQLLKNNDFQASPPNPKHNNPKSTES